MDAIKYFKVKVRMTNMCEVGCSKCPLHWNNNGKNVSCLCLEKMYPELAVEIVEKWEKENPLKTYLSVLLEKFPYTKMTCDGLPKYCPRVVFNIDQTCPGTSCKDCWNRECEEIE